MLIHILSQDNFNQFNITLAHKIGLENAIYFNEILNIYSKASRKSKIKSDRAIDELSPNDDYFIVDRKYITKRTTLTEARQYKIDDDLINLGLIKKSRVNVNEICINQSQYISIFLDANEKIFKQIVNEVKPKKSSKAQTAEYYKESIKFIFKSDDEELYNCWCNWVEAISSNPKISGRFNVASAKEYKNNLEYFANGHRDALIELIKLGTESGYSIAEWVINLYRGKHKELASNIKRLPATNNNKVLSKESNPTNIDLDEFF